MQYESIPQLSRTEIERNLASDDEKMVSYAILSASLHDPDWHWAQAICLRFLDDPRKQVRWNASTGLSHVARIHHKLDTEIVLPRLRALLQDVEVRSNVEDSLGEIHWWLKLDGAIDRTPINMGDSDREDDT